MEIEEHRDHSCKKWAECSVGKNLDDEVNVECVEYEGAMIHDERRKVNGAPPGTNRKKVAVNLGEMAENTIVVEGEDLDLERDVYHVMSPSEKSDSNSESK